MALIDSGRAGEMGCCKGCGGPRTITTGRSVCFTCLRGSSLAVEEAVGYLQGDDEADTIEQITHKAIQVALSVSELFQDIAKIHSMTILWRRDKAADRLREIHELANKYVHPDSETRQLMIGDSFGFIVRNDVPKGKVYLIPDEVLELEGIEDIRDWIKSHPDRIAVMENIGEQKDS